MRHSLNSLLLLWLCVIITHVETELRLKHTHSSIRSLTDVRLENLEMSGTSSFTATRFWGPTKPWSLLPFSCSNTSIIPLVASRKTCRVAKDRFQSHLHVLHHYYNNSWANSCVRIMAMQHAINGKVGTAAKYVAGYISNWVSGFSCLGLYFTLGHVFMQTRRGVDFLWVQSSVTQQ